MNSKLLLLSAIVSLCYMTFGTAVDTHGNSVGLGTKIWDINSKKTTVGDLKEVMTPGYDTLSNDVMKAGLPRSFVVSPDASYEYNGGGSIPNGYYYKAVTGEGIALYAAKVPFPRGRIVLSADSPDDPIVERFGGALEISDITTIVNALGGYEENGKFSVADLVSTPSALLNLAVVLHTNILNPLPEITGSTMTWTDSHLAITTSDGIQHSLYFPTSENATTYTYTDYAYDPSSGDTTDYTRTLTISYASDVALDYGVAFFGPTEFATIDQIDTARSRLMERTGRPNELGTGWGYKIYDFKSDERRWELQVPRLTPSVTTSNFSWDYNSLPLTSVPDDAMEGYYYGRQFRFNGHYREYSGGPVKYHSAGLLLSSDSIFKELVATSNKYSTAGSQYADWRIGLIPRKEKAETADDCWLVFSVTNIAIGISGRPYLWGGIVLENETDLLTGVIKSLQPRYAGSISYFSDLTFSYTTNMMPIAVFGYQGETEYMTWGGGSVAYTNTTLSGILTFTYSNFRLNSITYNNYTATINIGYNITVTQPLIYLKTDGTFGYSYANMRSDIYGASHDLVLRTAQNLETYTAHANRVITDYNQHMIYDPGLKCTWEIACTNGVFFTRKVSRDDYRKVEFVEQ